MGANNKKLTTKEFIQRAIKVHGDKYDYSKSIYLGNKKPLEIICQIHGSFWKAPDLHTNKQQQGCPVCGSKRRNINSKLKAKNEFEEKANKIHNNFYDYSKVVYDGTDIKVIIICPIHGEFLQTPHAHVGNNTNGCPVCSYELRGLNARMSKDEYFSNCLEIHNKKYDYSNAVYKGMDYEIEIICPIHGSFWKKAGAHYYAKQGCAKCLGRNLTTEELVLKFKEIHNDTYDYSKVVYVDGKEKVEIICPIHGSFWQEPNRHLQGQGCPICGIQRRAENATRSKEDFIEKANKIHNNFYDYSKVNYISSKYKIEIICPIHGSFWQQGNSHLQGFGCAYCSGVGKLSTEEIIKRAKVIHGDIYNYSKCIFKGSHKKITVICKKHGEFYPTPHNHLRGSGCPMCNLSKGELKIEKWLNYHNFEFIPQKKFNDCRNKNPLPFDFYVPSKNTLIEFDGKQHYEVIDYFGGEKALQDTIKKDFIKTQYAKNKGIRLIRVAYDCTDEEIMSLLTPLLTSET